MKKLLNYRKNYHLALQQIGAVIFLVCATQAGATYASECPVVTGDDYQPYAGKDLKNFGLASDIVAQTFASMGCEVTIDFLPWKRGYAQTQKGEYLATFPYGKNPKREESFLYSDPLYSVAMHFFVKKDSGIGFDSDEDLAGKRICVPIGYNPSRLKELVSNNLVTLNRPANIEACFRMLDRGRTDMVRVVDSVGQSVAKAMFGSDHQFTMLSKPLRETVEYLIVSRSHPEAEQVINEFNSHLRQLRDDGRIDTIIGQHLQQ